MFPASPQPSSGGFRALIKNRAFMRLWIGQVLSQLADKVFFVLLIALLVNYEPIPALANSMRSAVMIANTLPAVFFGSAAGIFVDRWSKKHILWSGNFFRGLLVLAIPFLPKAFTILLVVAFVESVLTQFFAPAEQAAIPLLVRSENLMSANALFTTTTMGSLVVGFAIGEPILSGASHLLGRYGREVLVGGLYLLAAITLYFVPLRESPDPEGAGSKPWQDFKQGLQYLTRNRLVKGAMVQLTVLYCVFAALSILAIGLAEEIGLKPTQFGFLLAAAGVGLILGAGILGHWEEFFHERPLPLLGFLAMAAVLLAFSFINYLWLGLLLSVLLGLGAALIGVPMQTLVQTQTPPSMRGKVFGVQNNILNIALSVPLALAGLLADAVGLRTVLVAMSIISASAGIWAWRSTRKVLKDVI
jgi:predicted MFS family arabinose efflux permease